MTEPIESKYPFFFDYIYYRLIQVYFKWDGRNGATALIGIVMIQALLILDVMVFTIRVFYDRDVTKNYVGVGKWIIILIFIGLMIYNYRKYHSGRYNKLRLFWKNEDKTTRIWKGLLVLLALIIPWVPLILIGVYM